MDEILFALKEHIIGLNCGRWDYIFSYVKTLRKHLNRFSQIDKPLLWTRHFLNAYSRLLVKTCHRRGAFAMGGMAAFIPAKEEDENRQVLSKLPMISRLRQAMAMMGHGLLIRA